MRGTFLTRIVLFLTACCGWAILFFGGWIAWRGVFRYAADPVLMGTGGGLAIGGLLVVALSLAALVQLRTSETVTEIRDRLDRIAQTRRPLARAAPPLSARRDD